MREDERRKFVGVSFKNGDALVMAACLHAPAPLSGMSDVEHDVCVDRYRRALHPQEADRIERLVKAYEAAGRAGKCFVSLVESVAKSPQAVQAEENAAKLRALEAAE